METTTESQLEEGSAKWHIRNIEAMSIEEMVKFSALRLDEVKKELELLEREVEGFEKEEREEREEEERSGDEKEKDVPNAPKKEEPPEDTNPNPAVSPPTTAPASPSNPSPTFLTLPLELFDQILSYLPLTTLDSLRCVSHPLRARLSQPYYLKLAYTLALHSDPYHDSSPTTPTTSYKLTTISTELLNRASWRYPSVALEWDLSPLGEDLTADVQHGLLVVWSLVDAGGMGRGANLWVYGLDETVPKLLCSTRTEDIVREVRVERGAQQDSTRLRCEFEGGGGSVVYQMGGEFVKKGRAEQRRWLRVVSRVSARRHLCNTERAFVPAEEKKVDVGEGWEGEGEGERVVWDGRMDGEVGKWCGEGWREFVGGLRIVEERRYRGEDNEQPVYTLYFAHVSKSDRTTKLFATIFTREDAPVTHICVACRAHGPYIPLFPEHTHERDRFSQNLADSLRCSECLGGPTLHNLRSPYNGATATAGTPPGSFQKNSTYLDIYFTDSLQRLRTLRTPLHHLSTLLSSHSTSPCVSSTPLPTIRTKILHHLLPSTALTLRTLQLHHPPTSPPFLLLLSTPTPSLLPLPDPLPPGLLTLTPTDPAPTYDTSITSISSTSSSTYTSLLRQHTVQKLRRTHVTIVLPERSYFPEGVEKWGGVLGGLRRGAGGEGRIAFRSESESGVVRALGGVFRTKGEVFLDPPGGRSWLEMERIVGFGSGGEAVEGGRVDRRVRKEGSLWWWDWW